MGHLGGSGGGLDHRVVPYVGDRSQLCELFELADDSPQQLASYIDEGDVLVAAVGDQIVGHLQLVRGSTAGEAEIKNMAVQASFQGRGVGRSLVEAAIGAAIARGRARLIVATGAADVGNLRFYQRLGFRMTHIERDAFTPATGYDHIFIDGIELRDRVWLAIDL